MKLSQLGELGLLAELERRGLAQGIENDAAQLGELVVTQDALVEGVHFRFDLARLARLGLPRGGRQPERPRCLGCRPEALVVTLGAPRGDRARRRPRALRGPEESGVPVAGGDTTRADRPALRVTALGRSQPRAGPGRRPARRSSGRHGPARSRRRRLPGEKLVRPPLRLDERRELAAYANALLDSRTASRSTRATSRPARGSAA